jgi:hypothetical protein
LLHFDGGWPLKVYAKDQQDELIDLLCARGYSVTVLAGTQYEHPKCQVTTFKGYEPFVELMRSHHLLVGMDSFPVHYAAHVLGLPTICLFASTRPENSNARPAINYSYLEKGLQCRPCLGIARCPRYGGSNCRNFVDPLTVVTEVEGMLDAVDDGKAVRFGVPEMSTGTVVDEARPASRRLPKKKMISFRYLWLKAVLIWPVLSYWSYLFRLHDEFAAVVKTDGFLLAVLRTLRFLRRSFRT